MKTSKFTEEQIAFALKQAETGTPVKEVVRKMGITEQTFYRWKKKYGSMMPLFKKAKTTRGREQAIEEACCGFKS